MNKKSLIIQLTVVLCISLLACALILILVYRMPPPQLSGTWPGHLAYLNGFLNALSAYFLVRGYRYIKRKEIAAHQRSMQTAFICSALFLVSYLTYHYLHGDTKFLLQGPIRPIYFFILISHIILSIPCLGMVLATFYLAWVKAFDWHRPLARWTFPVWLYVSITGVLLVIMVKGQVFFGTH